MDGRRDRWKDIQNINLPASWSIKMQFGRYFDYVDFGQRGRACILKGSET